MMKQDMLDLLDLLPLVASIGYGIGLAVQLGELVNL